MKFLYLLYLLHIVTAHAVINEITPDYHSNDIRLPGVMNSIIGEITAIRVLKNENMEMHSKSMNENKIETLFLVIAYSDLSHCLMVLTQEGHYYIVRKEKTYYVSIPDEYSALQEQYKFLYYENLDDSLLTLEDVEDYMTNKDFL